MDFEDQKAIAGIAALANISMANSAKLATNSSEARTLGYRRTDFKEFLTGQGGQNNQYQQGRPLPPPNQFHNEFSHPHWQNNVPQNIPGWNSDPNDGVPAGNLNGPIKQYTLPPQYNVPNNGVQVQQSYNDMQQPNPVMENTGNFVMPNYNQQSSQKIYLEDEQEFRDALIKEIKSQKKAINKLIKTNDQLIVTVQTLKDKMFELAELLQVKLTPEPIPTEEIIDEVDNKS
jgi:hypothetical protein